LATKWSDCSVVKICYADVHLLRSLQKIIRGNVASDIPRLLGAAKLQSAPGADMQITHATPLTMGLFTNCATDDRLIDRRQTVEFVVTNSRYYNLTFKNNYMAFTCVFLSLHFFSEFSCWRTDKLAYC